MKSVVSNLIMWSVLAVSASAVLGTSLTQAAEPYRGERVVRQERRAAPARGEREVRVERRGGESQRRERGDRRGR